MAKTKVLFLCTGNSARSQMAEGFLRHYAGDRFDVYSAGLDPKGVNPFTVRVMKEAGVDIGEQWSKSLRDYLGHMHFEYLITVCADADQNCPTTFLGFGNKLHWPFDDPAAVQGSDDEKLSKFREVRDQIRRQIHRWVGELEPAS